VDTPALSSSPGHASTQEDKCFSEGKLAALAPASAMICCAEATPDRAPGRAAALTHVRQCLLDLLFGHPRIFIQERFSRKDHSAEAKPTLAGLLINKKTAESHAVHLAFLSLPALYLPLASVRRQAPRMSGRSALNNDCASSTLPKTAAKLRSAQLQIVTKHIQQWGLWISIYRMQVTVHFKRDICHVLALKHHGLLDPTTDSRCPLPAQEII
jgi:hypothetical protein